MANITKYETKKKGITWRDVVKNRGVYNTKTFRSNKDALTWSNEVEHQKYNEGNRSADIEHP